MNAARTSALFNQKKRVAAFTDYFQNDELVKFGKIADALVRFGIMPD